LAAGPVGALPRYRPGQYRVLAQDRRLQIADRRARIDAKVRGQDFAQPPGDGQCLGLAPGSVQHQHQLAVQLLVVGRTGEQVLKLPNQIGTLALRDPGPE
jgi:hypothetical protein